MPELIARLRAVIRRSAGHADAVLRIGPVELDRRHMQVAVAGLPVRLSPNEHRPFGFSEPSP